MENHNSTHVDSNDNQGIRGLMRRNTIHADYGGVVINQVPHIKGGGNREHTITCCIFEKHSLIFAVFKSIGVTSLYFSSEQ